MKIETIEAWEPIPGQEFYEASDQGRVRSLPRDLRKREKLEGDPGVYHYPGAVLGGHTDKIGRVRVKLGKKSPLIGVDLLVLRAFVGVPKAPSKAAWRNGDRSDNRLCNLFWAPRS